MGPDAQEVLEVFPNHKLGWGSLWPSAALVFLRLTTLVSPFGWAAPPRCPSQDRPKHRTSCGHPRSNSRLGVGALALRGLPDAGAQLTPGILQASETLYLMNWKLSSPLK